MFYVFLCFYVYFCAASCEINDDDDDDRLHSMFYASCSAFQFATRIG